MTQEQKEQIRLVIAENSSGSANYVVIINEIERILTPSPQEGRKTAKEILIDFGFTNDRGYLEYDGIIHFSDIEECMEEYASQFKVSITDEEIRNYIVSELNPEEDSNGFEFERKACRGWMDRIAKWMRDKYEGK